MELENAADIKKAIENYSKDFVIFAKVKVNGGFIFDSPHPLFIYLRTQPPEL